METGQRMVVACFKPLRTEVLGSATFSSLLLRARDEPGGFPRPGSAARLSLKGEAGTDVSFNQENNVGSQMGCVAEARPLPPSLCDKVFLSGEQLSVRGWWVAAAAPAGHLPARSAPASPEEDLESTKASARCCVQRGSARRWWRACCPERGPGA